MKFLADYSPREDWYLGKPSIQAPLEIVNKDKGSVSNFYIFCLLKEKKDPIPVGPTKLNGSSGV